MTSYHIDAMAARMVMAPESLDVVVASNLFGDILTDIGAAIQGGLGFAASANINPDRSAPSMFEPVHGSAPDIAHLGIANPIAAIWSGAMMLDHLGENGRRRTMSWPRSKRRPRAASAPFPARTAQKPSRQPVLAALS